MRDTTLSDWLPTSTATRSSTARTSPIPDDEEIALGTTTVLAFDPASPTTRTSTAVATDSDTSYFSTDRFYLAAGGPQWGFWGDCIDCRIGACRHPAAPPRSSPSRSTGPTPTYVASGEVEGTIADRWSMDAVGDSLRVAVGPSSETGNFNSVLTLREDGSDLVEAGRVDDLGIDEQIKSVRWFDDLAIVVTFRQTDPLYAIDLSDPADPRLVGELKIPGFSEYLHPLGEHRLIGMGQDATLSGMTRGAQAALFDVTDLTNPRQLDVVRYGKNSQAGAGVDPRQFTWLPEQRVALTVVSAGLDRHHRLGLGALARRRLDDQPDGRGRARQRRRPGPAGAARVGQGGAGDRRGRLVLRPVAGRGVRAVSGARAPSSTSGGRSDVFSTACAATSAR